MHLGRFLVFNIYILLIPVLVNAQAVSSPMVRPQELNIQFHRAETAWKSGTSILEAKTLVDRVLKVLPDDAPALKLRAQVLMAMERPDEALADARRAVEINPEDGEAQLLLSEAALMHGDQALARRAMDEAEEHVLEDAGLHLRLSWVAMQLGDMEKSEAFARIALALDRYQPACYFQLAHVFLLEDRVDAAAETLARGLRSSVLDADVIRRDIRFAEVIQHPTLIDFFK